MPRAVVLFSGGLDSMLSLRILQEQGFEVEALNVRTIYRCCQATAAEAALELGARLTVLPVGDDYLDVIRNPLYGFGKGANPCVDCRIYMCRMAKRFMEEVDACVVATGEVLGQRPMSQKRQHLEVIAQRSGLGDRLLRPLSAKLLPSTAVEQSGLVDRERLYDFHGRGRRRLIDLARQLRLPEIPSPSTGCALTEPLFAPRVFDLLEHRPQAGRWDFELLNHGRHIRLDERTKVVLGRNAADNLVLERFADDPHRPPVVMLRPEDFRGPAALVIGPADPTALRRAAALMLCYSGDRPDDVRQVRVTRADGEEVIRVSPDATAEQPRTL